MAKQQKHYSIKNIREKNANYNIIYGEKSNGKSYQVKHEIGVIHYLKTGKRFILMRRWDLDISSLWILQYFADVDVERLTDGKYNCITSYRRELWFGNIESGGKVKRGEKIRLCYSIIY